MYRGQTDNCFFMNCIVLIDGEESIHEIFHIAFHDRYKVLAFKSGEALMDHRIEAPDLFVLDKTRQVPGGLELCRFIKSDRCYSHVPVLLFSAKTNIINPGRAAGADIIIEKPFCLHHLREQVDFLVAIGLSSRLNQSSFAAPQAL